MKVEPYTHRKGKTTRFSLLPMCLYAASQLRMKTDGKNPVPSCPVHISIFIPLISVFTEKYKNGTGSGRRCIPPVFAGSRF